MLRADVLHALRALSRARGVVVTVVVVLGAAIGLNATLFTVIAGMVWRPWSGVAEPDRLVRVYAQDASGQVTGLSAFDARSLAGRTVALQGVATMRGDAVQIEGLGTARALMISGDLLDLLGVSPVLGRRIVAQDDRRGAPVAAAMLTESTWRRRFGANPQIVGTLLRIDGVPFTIVGVVSQAFESAEPAYDIDVYLPAGTAALIRREQGGGLPDDSRACCVEVVARLRRG